MIADFINQSAAFVRKLVTLKKLEHVVLSLNRTREQKEMLSVKFTTSSFSGDDPANDSGSKMPDEYSSNV